MATSINAKGAIELAKNFLEDYHDSFRLISTTLEEDVWTVVCDAGFLREEIKKIQPADSAEGEIPDYPQINCEKKI